MSSEESSIVGPADSYEAFKRSKRFLALDGLRAISGFVIASLLQERERTPCPRARTDSVA